MATQHLLSTVRRLWAPAAIVVLLACRGWSAEPEPKKTPANTTAANLVRAALEKELAGDNQGRDALLHEALDESPNDAAANWQLGKVQVQGKWRSTADVERESRLDERLTQYRRLRDAARPTVADQAALARWCQKNHLDDEQRLHWLFVLQFQPNNAEAIAAMKRLPPLRAPARPAPVQQVYATPREINKAADRWRPLVIQWRNAAQRGDAALSPALRGRLVKISDPTDVLGLERALWQQVVAKRQQKAYHFMLLAMMPALGENPHPVAAAALARCAVFADFDDVRAAAAAGLKRRPLDHYAPLLLSGLQMPIEAEAQYVLAANGDLISHYSVFQEGALANRSLGQTLSPLISDAGLIPPNASVTPGTGTVQFDSPAEEQVMRRSYPRQVAAAEAQAAANARALPGDIAAAKAYNTLAARANYQANAQNSQAEAVQDKAALQEAARRANEAIGQQNARIVAVLRETTGLDLGDNPMKWWAWWWQDYNETYNVAGGTDQTAESQPPKPEYHYEYHSDYQGSAPTYLPASAGNGPVPCSCFAPGTKVWTLTGRQAIEKIKVGDRVLAQNVESGELAYKPVLGITLRKPGPRMKIRVGEETITATPSHPFWVAGQGWRMTKQLAAGSRLHTLSGSVPVETIEKLPVDPSNEGLAYNLIVADFDSYFVGDCGILVHDNTPRMPTAALLPGLGPPAARP